MEKKKAKHFKNQMECQQECSPQEINLEFKKLYTLYGLLPVIGGLLAWIGYTLNHSSFDFYRAKGLAILFSIGVSMFALGSLILAILLFFQVYFHQSIKKEKV